SYIRETLVLRQRAEQRLLPCVYELAFIRPPPHLTVVFHVPLTEREPPLHSEVRHFLTSFGVTSTKQIGIVRIKPVLRQMPGQESPELLLLDERSIHRKVRELVDDE